MKVHLTLTHVPLTAEFYWLLTHAVMFNRDFNGTIRIMAEMCEIRMKFGKRKSGSWFDKSLCSRYYDIFNEFIVLKLQWKKLDISEYV